MAIFSFASTSLFLISCVLDQLRFSEGSEWNYETKGEHGPSSWSKIAPVCAGIRQSPIDIVQSQATYNGDMGAIKFKGYDVLPSNVNYTFTNTGHTVLVDVPVDLMSVSGGGLNGTYKLAQFHAHWGGTDGVGSEHTIDGKSNSLELHFVHFSDRFSTVGDALGDPKGLAVIGVLAKIGTVNRGVDNVVYQLSRIQFKESVVKDVSPFKVGDILPSNTSDFVRYDGSLTTPKCQESVIWTVFKNPITISKAQINAFRGLSRGFSNETVDALQNNNRPVQKLGSRTVLKTYKGGAGRAWLHREAVFFSSVLLSLGLQPQSALH